jgi:SOS response regulatory protein OraA/RecX
MDLLARREHGSQELLEKLRKRFRRRACNDEQVQEVLIALTNEGLLSDERFAVSTVRQLVGRGYGPRRIQETFRQQGIDGYLSRALAAAFDAPIDWYAEAASAYQKNTTVTQLWGTGTRVSARGLSECGFCNTGALTRKCVRAWCLMAPLQMSLCLGRHAYLKHVAINIKIV